MSKIAVIRLTDFPEGAIDSMVAAFSVSAVSLGHEVECTLAERSHTCSCGGCCGDDGCGDDDCLCTFSKSEVDKADAVVFAIPCDGDLSMGQLRHIVDKSVGKCADGKKKLMLISCSPSFDESVFSKITEYFRGVCESRGWEYAGDALVEGLPDACLGGDPISKKKARALASLV